MKPETRSSARSRPRNLDVSSQMELFASLPAQPAEEESVQTKPEPQPSTTVDSDESDFSAAHIPLPDDATDFDPATLETMTTMPEEIPPQETAASDNDDTWSRPDPRPEDRVEVTPAPEERRHNEGSFDLFESDPFFNPSSAPTVPSGPVAAESPTPAPPPSAEERLLDTIVSKPAETMERAALNAIDQTTTERDLAQARIKELEKELVSVCEQLLRESQLRKAEAARFVASERELTRKSLAATGGTMKKPGVIDEAHHRFPAPVIALILLALILATGLAFFAGRSCESRQDLSTAVSPAEAPAEAAIEANPAPVPAITPARVEAQPAPVPWPVLEGKGFKTARAGNTLNVRFTYGVFARGTEMTGAACQDLRRIASTLTPSSKQLRIEVQGHTDAAPVSSGRPYAGNYELGLSRAKVVAEYLTKQCGLPADMLTVTSAGEANPPYPNTTPESRRLNRTVILKLTPAEGH